MTSNSKKLTNTAKNNLKQSSQLQPLNLNELVGVVGAEPPDIEDPVFRGWYCANIS